jgi:RimJ/RimL family protein N-acetyltransferase
MEFQLDTKTELTDPERDQIIERELAAAPEWVSEGTDRGVLRANADYNYKVVRLDSGETAVFSLRFEGLDPSKPFVEAVACTAGPVLNPRQLNSVWNAVESLYGHIGIQRLRAFEPDVGRHDSGASRDTYDRLLLAGHVQEVASKTRELSEKGTTWHRTEERFREVVDEGLAFAVRKEGRLVGVVLLGRGTERWLRGYYFSEMFLFEDARNLGLATPIQRAVAKRIDSDKNTHLYGTIDPRNEPAIRAARGAGRRLAGGHRFLRR